MSRGTVKAVRLIRHEAVRALSIVCLLLFAVLPMLSLAFHITAEDIRFVLSDDSFRQAVSDSVLYTLTATVITILLALISACLLNASSLRHKNVFVILLTLGMLVPTVSIGLGIRILFGEMGFLDILLGIDTDARGFFGLILGSVITAFPAAFLILYDALRYEDKAPYDAASVMGISRFSTFFRLTLPYLRIALISAFFACFTLIFSDYGIPMETAGKVRTLPMYLYDNFLSSFRYGRGSAAGLVLLIPAAASFVFDILFRDSSVSEKQKRMIPAGRGFNAAACSWMTLLGFTLFLPQLSFISLTFTKAFPNDLSFTLSHLAAVFTDTHGVGLAAYIRNSLVLSVLTALLGTCFAYMLAYLSVRKSGAAGRVTDLLALSTIAIPGLVLGIGYIFVFSPTNGFFYGTTAILVAVNVVHFLGSPYLLAKNCLSKLNRDYEMTGETLGIPRRGIIRRVLLPGSVSTLIEMFSYFFLNSMITISAVAFLFSFSNQPLSILITTYEKSGNYEMQSVVSFLILILNAAARGILSFAAGKLKKKK